MPIEFASFHAAHTPTLRSSCAKYVLTDSQVPRTSPNVPPSLSSALLTFHSDSPSPAQSCMSPAGIVRCGGAWKGVDSGSPCSTAAAKVESLDVDPAWDPLRPPAGKVSRGCPRGVAERGGAG